MAVQSSKLRRISLCPFVAVILAGSSTLSLPAASWAAGHVKVLEQPYPYVVIEQDLREVLLELGRNLGIDAQLTKSVRGVVRGGAQQDETAKDFLRRLGSTHDLVWFLDHDTLLVSTRQENITDNFSASHLNAQRRSDLAREWSDKGAGVRVTADDRSGRLLVTGPSSFQDRIAAVLAVAEKKPMRTTGSSVTVFRSGSGSQEVTVPH